MGDRETTFAELRQVECGEHTFEVGLTPEFVDAGGTGTVFCATAYHVEGHLRRPVMHEADANRPVEIHGSTADEAFVRMREYLMAVYGREVPSCPAHRKDQDDT